MKPVRITLAVLTALLVLASFLPVAAQPAQEQTLTSDSPAQAFIDAAYGLPLLAPMSVSTLPLYTVQAQSAAAGTDYACMLISQKPKDWTQMKRRQYFDASWTVKNTGNRVWGKNGIDLVYVGGTKMHTRGDSYDLKADVGTGKKTTLSVDMNAPKTKGYYTAIWGISKGTSLFCRLYITINVNK